MNIGLQPAKRDSVIAIFTWVWLVGSVIVSAYFSFSLFPNTYTERSSAIVEVWFQTQSPTGAIVYYPNEKNFRKAYLDRISDNRFLYFNACELMPLSQQAICYENKNWKKLDLISFQCKDVKSCLTTVHKLGKNERERYFADLNLKPGVSFSLADKAELKLSEPLAWGHAARWPLFFILIFLSLKLGR